MLNKCFFSKSFLFFVLFVYFNLFGLNAFSQKKCSSDDIPNSACDYLKKNSDKKVISTSDGGQVENPYYSSPITPKSLDSVVVVSTSSNDEKNLQATTEIMVQYELELDDLLADESFKILPRRSLQYLKKPRTFCRFLI